MKTFEGKKDKIDLKDIGHNQSLLSGSCPTCNSNSKKFKRRHSA